MLNYVRPFFAVALSILFPVLIGVARGKEPTVAAQLDSSGPATTFTASGAIDRLSRQDAILTFFADAPFWGPARYGGGVAVLWPKETVFMLFVPGMIPITLDGKKASFADLKIGQQIRVEYNLVEPYTRCVAHRIDAHTVPGSSQHPKAEPTPVAAPIPKGAEHIVIGDGAANLNDVFGFRAGSRFHATSPGKSCADCGVYRIEVSPAGKVSAVTVLKTLGQRADELAMIAFAKWKAKPGNLRVVDVKGTVAVPY